MARGKSKKGWKGVAAESQATMFVSCTRKAPIRYDEQRMEGMRERAKWMHTGERKTDRKIDRQKTHRRQTNCRR